MREIIFKAKRIDNGEWVIGGSIIQFLDDGVRSFYMPQFNEKCICEHDEVTDDILKFENTRFYKVDGNTLCQYTGLTDKNKNMIWENDVVTHTFTTYEGVPQDHPPFIGEYKKKNYVIKWDNTASYCGYRYHNGRNIFPFKNGTVINGDDEVIGNIFDNPELLGGKG